MFFFILILYEEGKCYSLETYQMSNNVIKTHQMYLIYFLQNPCIISSCYK